MKSNKFIWILMCVITFSINAQQTKTKSSQTIKTSKDVTIDLNTSYVEIEVDTWNKGSVEIEAYVEGEKLSEKELDQALKSWNLDIDGSFDRVTINSKGVHGSWAYVSDFDFDFDTEALKEMELELANLPHIPDVPDMPEMPEMPEMEMPEMPEIPELPELPEGINNVQFDTEAYKEGGEKYLEEWSKEYEEKYGKQYKEKMKVWARKMDKIDFSDYEQKMAEWGEKFGEKFGKDYAKKMEAWGEEFGKSFDGEWQAKMEAWGERYGKRMEEHAKRIEQRMEEQEHRHAHLAERHEERAHRMDERRHRLAEREAHLTSRSSKVKKVIKIKIPKNAKVNMNVRHGEMKFSSVIYNLKASISHASLLANHIDGGDTSINVSYSPVFIDLWSKGELKLNYVENADLKSVGNLVLGSNSSNIEIGNLSGNAIVEGSFGDLAINDISDSFNNLTVVLDNSDALITLPKVSHHFQFRGNRSRFKHPKKTSKESTSSFSTGDLSTNKSIVVTAKFSEVTMQ